MSDFAPRSVTATEIESESASERSDWRQMSGAPALLNTAIITCSEACGGSMDQRRMSRRRREKCPTFNK